MIRIVRFVFEHSVTAPIGVLIALLWANSAPESYFHFALTSAVTVNQVLMALVFAVAMQEVIEELIPGGALHPWKRALLPVIAGIGGSLGAIGAYEWVVFSGDEHLLAAGWPIVCVVDGAFAYFLVKSLFQRSGATAFILLLAIASNAIGLVAVGMANPLLETHPAGVLLAVVAVVICAAFRRARVRTFWPHLIVGGTLSWWGFAWSGIHPALSLLPIVPFFPHTPRGLELFTDAPHSTHESRSHFEHVFRIPAEIVMLLFALVNAGIITRSYGTGSRAVLIGALVGRPIGTLAITAIATGAGLHLPRNLGWKTLTVLACAASVGFVFSLFAAAGTFALGPVLNEVKLGAVMTLGGAVLTIALAWLLRVGRFARPLHVRERNRRKNPHAA
jgi:NhaA family Na+:H+ antiporter